MKEEKKTALLWIRKHRKALFCAGIGIGIGTGTAMVSEIQKRGDSLPLWEHLKEAAPGNFFSAGKVLTGVMGADPAMDPELNSLTNSAVSEAGINSQKVKRVMIRNLPKGWHACLP